MAKKRKQHNPLKRFQRLPVRMWSWESETASDGTRSAYGAMQLNHTWRGLTHHQTTSLLAHPNNYIVICRALCLDKYGEECIEHEAVSARQLRINQLEAHYETMRQGVIDECNDQGDTVIDVGWLIQTFSKTETIDDPRLPRYEAGDATPERRQRWLDFTKTLQTAA